MNSKLEVKVATLEEELNGKLRNLSAENQRLADNVGRYKPEITYSVEFCVRKTSVPVSKLRSICL